MKKGRLLKMMALAAAGMVLLSGNVWAEEAKSLKLGYAVHTDSEQYYITVREGLEKVCDEKEIELVQIVTGKEPMAVRAAVESMLNQGCNVICDFTVQPEISKTQADLCAEKGVPYICVEVDAGENSHFFGVSNDQAGRKMGEFLAEYVKNNRDGQVDAIGIINSPSDGEEVAKRTNECLKVLREQIPSITDDMITELPVQPDAAVNKQQYTDYFSKNTDKENIVMFSYSSWVNNSIYAAAEVTGMEDKVVYSAIDGSIETQELFKSGAETVNVGEVCNFPDRYGEYIVDIAEKLLAGETVEQFTYMDNDVLTPENVNELYPD